MQTNARDHTTMKLVQILFRYHGVIKRYLLHACDLLEDLVWLLRGPSHRLLSAGPLPVGDMGSVEDNCRDHYRSTRARCAPDFKHHFPTIEVRTRFKQGQPVLLGQNLRMKAFLQDNGQLRGLVS